MPDHPYTLVLFDGTCGLCNGFVDFLLARDRAKRLRFAPLQGETGLRFAARVPGIDSVIVVENDRLHLRSDGALLALSRLGGPWRAAVLLRAVPRVLRDAVYGVVARHRYRWFGRRAACRMPTRDEQDWFLL